MMRAETNAHKRSWQNCHETFSRETEQKVLRRSAKASLPASVVAPATARITARPEARKRYQRLAPWLELANLAARAALDNGANPSSTAEMMGPVLSFFDKAADTPDFPAYEILRWFRAPSTNQVKFRKQLFNLAIDVYRAFVFCLGEDPEGAFAFEEGPRFGTRLLNHHGLLGVERFDPYCDSFLPVIEGLETGRIRRCPVCRIIFFAVRYKRGSDYGSKACSRQCNQNLRVRRWRANQDRYRDNRKIAEHWREEWRKR